MTKRIAEEVNMPTEGLTLWWLGNAGFAIRYGEILMFIDPAIEVKSEDDPTLSEIGLRLLYEMPLKATEVEKADVVMLTHHHGDYAAPGTLTVLKKKGALFICPRRCLQVLDRIGVDQPRIKEVVYGQRITHKTVSIQPLRALHGRRHRAVSPQLDLGAGYVIRAGGHSIFHPGDTVLMEEHYELEGIEILLLPICSHSRTLVALPEILGPKYIIPMHYDTYQVTEDNHFWTYGNPEEVRSRIKYPERLMVLKQGEIFRPSALHAQ